MSQSTDVDWDEKFENALLVFIGDNKCTIYREGYWDEAGGVRSLTTGKLTGYWDKDRLLEAAKEHGVPALDTRHIESPVSAVTESPLLGQHPDKVDDYDGDPFGDDVGILTRVTPKDFVSWWLGQGATEAHYDRLPEW